MFFFSLQRNYSKNVILSLTIVLKPKYIKRKDVMYFYGKKKFLYAISLNKSCYVLTQNLKNG